MLFVKSVHFLTFVIFIGALGDAYQARPIVDFFVRLFGGKTAADRAREEAEKWTQDYTAISNNFLEMDELINEKTQKGLSLYQKINEQAIEKHQDLRREAQQTVLNAVDRATELPNMSVDDIAGYSEAMPLIQEQVIKSGSENGIAIKKLSEKIFTK